MAHSEIRTVMPPGRLPPVVLWAMLPMTGAPTPGLNWFTGSFPVTASVASALPSASVV